MTATNPSRKAGNPMRVLVLTADPDFARLSEVALSGPAGFETTVLADDLRRDPDNAMLTGAEVVVLDVDATSEDMVDGFARWIAGASQPPPVIAVTSNFGADMARRFLQLRVSDFILKPVGADDLARACSRARQGARNGPRAEAEIFAFLPASGGVGVTTLAIETALLLARHGRRGAAATCLVDLDFQHGACGDYLDLEPRLDLDEIEPRPERLDSQLLEVMLSQHASGLSVICAPNRPAEMRSFDPNVVTRLLDLVSARFDYVVLDLPRTWFAWTDSILLGSDNAFIVAEATVPGLRHANALVEAITQRLGEAAQPRVIVNRFEQRMFAAGIKRADIQQALGNALAGTVPNNYRLVREAIDRGVPLEEVKTRSDVSAELKRIVIPQPVKANRLSLAAATARLGLSQAT